MQYFLYFTGWKRRIKNFFFDYPKYLIDAALRLHQSWQLLNKKDLIRFKWIKVITQDTSTKCPKLTSDILIDLNRLIKLPFYFNIKFLKLSHFDPLIAAEPLIAYKKNLKIHNNSQSTLYWIQIGNAIIFYW